MTNQVVYSADWSLDLNPSDEVPPSTSNAGTTVRGTSRNYQTLDDIWIFDAQSLFIIGINMTQRGAAYDEVIALTGSQQRIDEYTLICCRLGD